MAHPLQSDRFHCKGSGLFAIVRVQCKLRRIEAKLWEASNGETFCWATDARGVERCVWEQAAWSEWATRDGHAVATILYDLPKAFDHVAHQQLNDAAVRTRFPVRQLKLLIQLYQAARHVELDGVAGEGLRSLSSSCCWWGSWGHPTFPSEPWSTTPCSNALVTTTMLRRSSSSATAWEPSSRWPGAKSPPRSPRSSATLSPCGQSCSCGWRLLSCKRQEQCGASESISRQGSECPRRCCERLDTGLNETQLASYLAKQLHGKCVTMV